MASLERPRMRLIFKRCKTGVAKLGIGKEHKI